MFTFTYTAALLAITFAICAVFLVYKYRRHVLARALALVLAGGALWVGANAGADVAYTDGMNIFWSGTCFISGSLILSFFLIFVDVFIDRAVPSRPRLALYLLPSLAMAPFAYSKYSIVETVFPLNAPSAIVPGPLYHFYLLFFFISVAYGLVRLVRHYRRATGKVRYQAAYVIIGFSGFFLGLISFNVLLPLAGELRFFNVGPQFAALFFIASAHAIFRHQLLDIRLLVQRGIVYSLVLGGIIMVYVAVLLILEQTIELAMGLAAPLSAGIVMLIGIYTVPALECFFRRKTDRLFFKDSYDYSTALQELSDILNATLSRQTLIEEALRSLVRILRIKSAAFESSRDGNVFKEEAVPGAETHALCVPVRLDTEAMGMLHLGAKRSDDPYSTDDVKLLRTFASQAAVAIKKADLYQELKEYSIGLEQKVHERTAHLEELQKSQRRMIDDVSHELQNPLAVIKTTAELLLRNGSGDLKNHFSVIEHSVDNLSRLVANLLRLARMETEEAPTAHTRFDLSRLTQEISEYTEVTSKEHGIELATAIEPDICITGRKELIEELVTNLLSNAVKYTRESPVRQICIELTSSHGFAELAVRDTGIGIAPEDLPHIFERFYRARAAGNKAKGTGLGLAISRKIATQHGGELRAESAGIGKGSAFILALPITKCL